MGKRNGNTILSDLYCVECGFHMTIQRKKCKSREKGHLKTMWCCKCGKERKFIEVRGRDFLLSNVINFEIEGGNIYEKKI